MKRFSNQILGGTRLDSHGEHLPRELLQKLCEKLAGRRLPLHQHHDMARQTLGYIENLHLAPDKNLPGEWSLVGDVMVEAANVDEALKGFSISTTQPIREVQHPDLLLYLPFPIYNDQAFLDTLFEDSTLTVGKLIKKHAELDLWAVFGATIIVLVTPIWDDLYKRKIAPLIERFLRDHLPRLKEKGVRLEHIQPIEHQSQVIELRFIPSPGKEEFCFAPELLQRGISIAIAHLEQDVRFVNPGIERIVLYYDPSTRSYIILRVEYNDGAVEQNV